MGRHDLPWWVGAPLKFWYVVLALLLLGVAGGFWYSSQPAVWDSRATVLLRPTPGNALSPDMLVSAQQSIIGISTEAQLVTSAPVILAVNEELDTELEPGDEHISVSAAQNTQILAITYRADTAAEAFEGARVIANTYLDFRRSQSTEVQDRKLDTLNDELADAQRRLTRWLRNTDTDTRDRAVAATQVQLWSSRVAAVQESIGLIEAEDIDPGRLVAPPSKAESDRASASTVWGVALGGGLLAGMALAVMLGWLRMRKRP